MNPTIEKPEDGFDIVHPKHGLARCRRDQLDEFRGCGWKPAGEASEAEVKAAKDAHAKGNDAAKAAQAAAKKARADEAAKAAAKKK